MCTKRHSAAFKILSVALIFIFILPTNVYASTDEAVSPRASYYLTSYSTYINPGALGKIEVWFSVTGVEYMDEIGTLTIQLYESTDNENWTWVKTYKHSTTPEMLAYDTIYYSHHVDYQGTIGRYYKAYVCIWAGKDGNGDTRYMWTQPKKASLLGT